MISLVLALVLGSAPTLTHAPQPDSTGAAREWAAFLDRPTRARHDRLVEALRRGGVPGRGDVAKLSRLIQTGNESAVDIAFRTFTFLDGGELEDLLRAVAPLCERNPALLLTNLALHHSSDDRVRDLVTMLPEATVDHVREQRRILEARRRALGKVVATGSEARIREVALRALEQEIAALPSEDR